MDNTAVLWSSYLTECMKNSDDKEMYKNRAWPSITIKFDVIAAFSLSTSKHTYEPINDCLTPTRCKYCQLGLEYKNQMNTITPYAFTVYGVHVYRLLVFHQQEAFNLRETIAKVFNSKNVCESKMDGKSVYISTDNSVELMEKPPNKFANHYSNNK